jgi:hypothetical protein
VSRARMLLISGIIVFGVAILPLAYWYGTTLVGA